MRWVTSGVAAVSFSAPTSVSSVDLVVGLGGRSFARAELPVTAQWPAAAEVDVAAVVATGASFEVGGSASSVDASPLDAGRLRGRCADRGFEPVPFTCQGRAGPADVPVVMGALVDGRVVPLAAVMVRVRPVPDVITPMPVAEERRLSLAVFARGSLDVWRRYGGAAGARGWVAMSRWLRVGLALEYSFEVLASEGLNLEASGLDGIRHGLTGLVLAEIAFGDKYGGAFRLGLGGGWTRASTTIDGRSASADVAHITGRCSAGPRFRMGRVRLGIDLGVSLGMDIGHQAWSRAPLGGFLEVNGAIRL